MSKTQEFEYESVQNRNNISNFLKSLLEGLDSQCINLKSDQDEIVLCPQELINFTIKAKRKGPKSKLSLKLEWKELDPVGMANPISIES